MYSSCAVFKNVGVVKTLHSSRYRVFNCYDFKFVIFNCKPGLLAVLAVRVSCLQLCYHVVAIRILLFILVLPVSIN